MNNWLNENKEQIEYYISSKDAILIGRQTQLLMLLDIFQAVFDQPENLTFLDVGCGDGVLTKLLFDLYPNNTFHLLDGSQTMLAKAKENIKSANTVFINDTFENFFRTNQNESYYDFIFSSMAVHHLEHHLKFKLYSRIFTLLKHHGLFLNLDVVLPGSARTESIQFKMWVDYINDYLQKRNPGELGKHDHLPDEYKMKSENKPSSLASQLKMLEDIGYQDVECYYKDSIFVLFGGMKI